MMMTILLVMVVGVVVMELSLFVYMIQESQQSEATYLLDLIDSSDNFKDGRISNATVQEPYNSTLPLLGKILRIKTGNMRVTTKTSPGYSTYAGLIRQIEAGPKNSPPAINAPMIRQFIVRSNREQTMYNLDKFDMQSGPKTLVLVVQVHNRVNYLKQLINSLRNAKNIEHSLLIFSHDMYDQEVNAIVKAINFCPVSVHLKQYFKYSVDLLLVSLRGGLMVVVGLFQETY